MKSLDELDRLSAIHCMGWTFEQDGQLYSGHQFQPTRRIEQAWELIAKLATDEWKSTIYAGDQKQSCVIFKYSESFHEYGETIEESIVRACLKAKGVEID